MPAPHFLVHSPKDNVGVVVVEGLKAGTEMLGRLFQDDGLYEGGVPASQRLPTFTGNHDFGRLAMKIQRDRPGVSADEKAEGWILPCIAEPVGDVTLDVPYAFSVF